MRAAALFVVLLGWAHSEGGVAGGVGPSALIDLYSCGARDCSTGGSNVCGVIAAFLPTNGTCTWTGGAYCFTASPDNPGGSPLTLTVAGYRWGPGLGCACGAAPSWGSVSDLAVSGITGCTPVQGGTGGGAYALPGGQAPSSAAERRL